MLKKSTTARGFKLLEFKDRYDQLCNIQESSLATESAIWIGVEDANPQVLATEARTVGIKTEVDCGWIPYPIPEQVSLSTRMHLTQEQVAELLPVLTKFAKTGNL